MRRNPVKRKLAEGGVALGTMVFEFATPGLPRLAAAAGAEFAVFDQEHNGWSVETVRALIASARATELVPIVRVPATEYHLLARPLDVGAMGVMVPMVRSEEQARRVIECVRYPPAGRRGFGLLFQDDWEDGDAAATMARANEELLVIAQIEDVDGVESVERIAAVDGIDVLWIGHNDLTSSLGIPGRFDHPSYLRSLERVHAACARHGKAAGVMTTSVEAGAAQLAEGFRCLAFDGDLRLYQRALGEGIAALRAAAGAHR
jgi:2-dehydro-3-deoxyglucarate aldolase/4-hydroxy-2-oxoheptanedioate aldolase